MSSYASVVYFQSLALLFPEIAAWTGGIIFSLRDRFRLTCRDRAGEALLGIFTAKMSATSRA